MSHHPGCPMNSSPYATCECAAIDLRANTEALERHTAALTRAPETLSPEVRALLTELLEVLKARARGHAIMYSDRVTPFIPRIEEVLK